MDPLNKAMMDAIQKAQLEKSEKIHRKIKFVLSPEMPIKGMTGIPVEGLMIVYYEMEVRDLALQAFMVMFEDLFKDLNNTPIGLHFLEAVKAGRQAIEQNPFLELFKDSVDRAAAIISKEHPGWDD